MKILVLGGMGFIGSHVARALVNSGMDVFVLGMGDKSVLGHSSHLRVIESVINRDSLSAFGERFDVVLNCAGSGSVGFSIAEPLTDLENNAFVTAWVLEMIRTKQPQAHLISLSSAAVYGQLASMPIHEVSATNPTSPYGFSKRISEQIAESYHRQYGIGSTQLRLFSVYGPGLRKQLLWDACRKLRAGDPRFFGTGRETRDWIYVDDIAALIQKLVSGAAQRNSVFDIMNVGTGIGTTIADTLDGLSKHLGIRVPIAFTGEKRAGDPEHLWAETDRARAVGWSPEVDLNEGLRRYVEWYRSEVLG